MGPLEDYKNPIRTALGILPRLNVPTGTVADVADAMCGGYACVARKNDGTAVAWGHGSNGGDTSNVDLTNIADAEAPTPALSKWTPATALSGR